MTEIKIRHGDGKKFLDALKAVSVLVEETDLDITPEGITIMAMDPSHVAMVRLEMSKDMFETYEVTENQRIRLYLSDLLKKLKSVKSDPIELSIDMLSRKLTASVTGKTKAVFTIPLLEPSDEKPPVPRLRFEVEARVISKSLTETIRQMGTVSDNMRIVATDDNLTFKVETELSKACVEYSKGSEELLELDVRSPSTAVYNINYLDGMVKAGARATLKIASLSFSTNMPLRVEYEFEDNHNAKLTYYLASRVQEDETAEEAIRKHIYLERDPEPVTEISESPNPKPELKPRIPAQVIHEDKVTVTNVHTIN